MSYQNSSKVVNRPWDESRLGYLGLAWYEKFGPVSLGKLQNHFGSNGGKSAWSANASELTKSGISEKISAEFCAWREKQDLNTLQNQVLNNGLDFILPWDKNYPVILRESHNPPRALFWRGAPMDNRPWIAVVGTRKMSTYGERATKHIVSGLIELGAGIVSGLALGIDGMAHKAALEAKGKTIAVLGSGIDAASIYPSSHKTLAEQILLTGGALISEFPPGTKGLKHHFPQRNRIIASLAKATVVVEADMQSGSVLTAKNALDENREVFAVPGSILNQGSRGVHALIREGASICENAADILNQKPGVSGPMPTLSRELTMDERNILDLCRTPLHIDDLARHLNTPAASIGSACMTLEMANALFDQGNQTYEITPTGRALLNNNA